MSPTARSLKAARELGFIAGVVERYSSYTRQRYDLFGFVDVIAVRAGVGVLGIQATSGSNHAARMAKIGASPDLPEILASGMRIEVWSWSKAGKVGKRKLWTLRREEVRA